MLGPFVSRLLRKRGWSITFGQNAQEHILKQADGKNRLIKAVADLSKAFALAVPHDEAMRIRDDVGFFQAVRTVIAKSVTQQHRPEQDLDKAIRQIVSRAGFSGEVVDIFASAGLKKPDISILSDDFLAEVSHLPQKNLAVEMLRKLLTNEIKARSRRNVVKSRLFSELLEGSIRKYHPVALRISLGSGLRSHLPRGVRNSAMKDEGQWCDFLVEQKEVGASQFPALATT
jgi:type I restriction enzyme R subunit